jgi:hypothetical protein
MKRLALILPLALVSLLGLALAATAGRGGRLERPGFGAHRASREPFAILERHRYLRDRR